MAYGNGPFFLEIYIWLKLTRRIESCSVISAFSLEPTCLITLRPFQYSCIVKLQLKSKISC